MFFYLRDNQHWSPENTYWETSHVDVLTQSGGKYWKRLSALHVAVLWSG